MAEYASAAGPAVCRLASSVGEAKAGEDVVEARTRSLFLLHGIRDPKVCRRNVASPEAGSEEWRQVVATLEWGRGKVVVPGHGGDRIGRAGQPRSVNYRYRQMFCAVKARCWCSSAGLDHRSVAVGVVVVARRRRMNSAAVGNQEDSLHMAAAGSPVRTGLVRTVQVDRVRENMVRVMDRQLVREEDWVVVVEQGMAPADGAPVSTPTQWLRQWQR